MNMKKIIFSILLITSLFAEYSVGDQISTEHQNLAFDVCYGVYDSDSLSLSDFDDENTVIWINMTATW